MVLDRLFLWVFGIVASVGSLMILSASPYIFEETHPIDVLKSEIGNTESKMLDEQIIG